MVLLPLGLVLVAGALACVDIENVKRAVNLFVAWTFIRYNFNNTQSFLWKDRLVIYLNFPLSSFSVASVLWDIVCQSVVQLRTVNQNTYQHRTPHATRTRYRPLALFHSIQRQSKADPDRKFCRVTIWLSFGCWGILNHTVGPLSLNVLRRCEFLRSCLHPMDLSILCLGARKYCCFEMIRSQKLVMIDATLCSIVADAMRVIQDISTEFRSALV